MLAIKFIQDEISVDDCGQISYVNELVIDNITTLIGITVNKVVDL